jgi:secondary thiamine-phosphate synthase enzyme
MKTFEIQTRSKCEFIEITRQVKDCVKDSQARSGICVVYSPHTTAAITINENADADVRRDMAMALQQIVPREMGFVHSEGNSDSHIQASLYNPSQVLIIEDGRLVLGRWQGIFFCEFDGPRNRTFFVQIVAQSSETNG